MPISIDDIAPKADTNAAPAAPAPAPTEDDGGAGVPEALAKLPTFNLLLQGKPPAVWASKDSTAPEVKVFAEHMPELAKLGFGAYITKSQPGAVLFNMAHIDPKQIVLADEKGELSAVAPPIEEVNVAIADGLKASPPAPAEAPMPAGAPMAAPTPTNKPLNTARIKNVTPGSPSSGPVPGQGRVMNSILKEAI